MNTIMTEEAGPAAKKAAPAGRQWEERSRERLRAAIKRFSKPLAELRARDANEGDTRLLVTDLLCEGFGFDKYEDLTTEYLVKGEFADYGIRVDKELIAFIEVKRITTKLGPKHLRQAEMYAVNEGVEWIILTNGAHWQVYHVSATTPIELDLTLDVDLLGDGTTTAKATSLSYLTRDSLKRRKIDELWKQKRATSPKALAAVLCSNAVVDATRKELRRRSGQKVDAKEVLRLLRETVIRVEAQF